jgi:2,4-dienoyl-CoA reductase (NADPH2)
MTSPVPHDNDPIFQPLRFRNLTVKNRIFRSSLPPQFDNYDGSGSQSRVNWERKFASGGVGAIISAFAPITVHGRILPHFALTDSDEKIPFWRSVIRAVHEYDCRYIIQLSHAGRQRDLPGVENMYRPAVSSSTGIEEVHGLYARGMDITEIRRVVNQFAHAARRAREAGADGVELHASHGYLFTQFLSSAQNRRTDDYGGSLENRARFLVEVVQAIRREVGDDFHVQAKLNSVDFANFMYPWRPKGNSLDEGVRICQLAVAAGLDAVHATIGSSFPHPLMPPGGFPPDEFRWASPYFYGVWRTRNYLMMSNPLLRAVLVRMWNRTKRLHPVEGVAVEYAREVRKHVDVPVLCCGGFQDGELIRRVISEGYVDAVAIGRPLLANPDLPHVLATGANLPERPCTFCNRCLLSVLHSPVGCYDLRRYDGDYERMIREVTATLQPSYPDQPIVEEHHEPTRLQSQNP